MADLNSLANEAEAILAQIVAIAGAAGEQQPQSVKQAAADIKAIREAAERQQKAAPQDPELWKALQVAAKTNPSIAAQIGAMTATGGENSPEGQKRRAAYRQRRDEERRKTRRASLFNRFRRVIDASIVPDTAGQRRRRRYREFKYHQQRGERRQRLFDRMANRTAGGRAGTMLDALAKGVRNPRDAATQISRFATAAGLKGVTPAAVKAASGPVAAAVAIAETAQRMAMGAQRFAVEASSPFMGKAEHGVAGGMAESATKAAVYGPLGMLKEMAMLPKHIADWDEALLESKKGLANFSGTLNRYFAEAERRQILRDVQSAQTTGGAVSALGGEWQKFLDEVRPLKDDITTHLAAILTMGTKMLRAVVLIAKVTTPVMQLLAAIYRAQLPKETGSTAFQTFTSNLDPHPGRIGSRRAPQRGGR